MASGKQLNREEDRLCIGRRPNYQEPSIDYCRRYASDHGIPANQMFIDHNGRKIISPYSATWPYQTRLRHWIAVQGRDGCRLMDALLQ